MKIRQTGCVSAEAFAAYMRKYTQTDGSVNVVALSDGLETLLGHDTGPVTKKEINRYHELVDLQMAKKSTPKQITELRALEKKFDGE